MDLRDAPVLRGHITPGLERADRRRRTCRPQRELRHGVRAGGGQRHRGARALPRCLVEPPGSVAYRGAQLQERHHSGDPGDGDRVVIGTSALGARGGPPTVKTMTVSDICRTRFRPAPPPGGFGEDGRRPVRAEHKHTGEAVRQPRAGLQMHFELRGVGDIRCPAVTLTRANRQSRDPDRISPGAARHIWRRRACRSGCTPSWWLGCSPCRIRSGCNVRQVTGTVP